MAAEGKSGEEEIPLYLQWIIHDDGTDQDFLDQLNKCTLTVWNHRSVLRTCWIYLTIKGRRDGIKNIFTSIKHFIDTAPAAIVNGYTLHETALYAWAHLVHYNIEVQRNPSGGNDYSYHHIYMWHKLILINDN